MGHFKMLGFHGSHDELSHSNLNLLMVPMAQQDAIKADDEVEIELEGEAHMA